MRSSAGYLLFFSFICLLLALAGLLGGTIGNTWAKYEVLNVTHEDGLWRSCSGNNCKTRSNTLEFDKGYRDKDAVLLVLIIAGAFNVFAGITAISMLCCRNNPNNWNCGSLVFTLLTFISTISAIGALIFAEIQYKKVRENTHGWSIIVAWIGTAFSVIHFILGFILIGTSSESVIVYSESQRHINGGFNY